MLKKQIKTFRLVMLVLFLVAGMGTGHLLNANSAEASGSCQYTYCSGGQCYSNQNMTSCASPDGQLPCTGHINCQKEPPPVE